MIIEVELDLSTSDHQRNPEGSGRIKIYISVQKSDVAAAAAITDAQTAISSQSGTFAALGAVLSKIDVFVNAVDQITNVRDSDYLKFVLIDLPLGVPLR
jgi:hypothetical protein